MAKKAILTFITALFLLAAPGGALSAQVVESKSDHNDRPAVSRPFFQGKRKFQIKAIRTVWIQPHRAVFYVKYFLSPDIKEACALNAYVPRAEHEKEGFSCVPAGDKYLGIPKGEIGFDHGVTLEIHYTGLKSYKSRTIEVVISRGKKKLTGRLFRWGQEWHRDPSLRETDTVSLQRRKKPKSKGWLEIEMYGGWAGIDPSDLNQRAVHDSRVQRFYGGDFLDDAVSRGLISSWSKTGEGDFRQLKKGLPLGMRCKYYLNRWFALSFGVTYLTGTREQDISANYSITNAMGSYSIESRYSPYTLHARGIAPLLGVHLQTRLNRFLELGAGFSAGPVFAHCSYSHEYSENNGLTGMTYERSIDVDGRGAGLAMDGMLRLGVNLGNGFFLFCESAYAYRVITYVGGSGSLTVTKPSYDQILWKGEWKMNESRLESYWGAIDTLRPSNSREPNDHQTRNFELDLSGFQLRLGLAYRFKL